jgi:hypothetical protein
MNGAGRTKLYGPPWRVDLFAPRVLTLDGLSPMGVAGDIGMNDGKWHRAIQSPPRELSLPADGILHWP